MLTLTDVGGVPLIVGNPFFTALMEKAASDGPEIVVVAGPNDGFRSAGDSGR